MDDHQTFQKCLSSCPEEVLLLFVAIGNPRWPPWTLIGWDIFDFFSRTIAWTITKLSTNVCLVVLKKCCYFSLQSEIQDGCLGLWLAETFSTSSQEPCMDDHQTCHKCSSSGPEEVFLAHLAKGHVSLWHGAELRACVRPSGRLIRPCVIRQHIKTTSSLKLLFRFWWNLHRSMYGPVQFKFVQIKDLA